MTVFLYTTGFVPIIPGRSVMILLGVLCHNGYIDSRMTAFFAIIASIIGVNIGYSVGKYALGSFIMKRKKFLFISKEQIEKTLSIGKRHGGKLIIPALFVGGFWLLVAVIPGMVGMKYSKFAMINNPSVIIWVIVLMSLGYSGGYVWTSNIISKSYIIIFVVILIAILIFVSRYISLKLQKNS